MTKTEFINAIQQKHSDIKPAKVDAIVRDVFNTIQDEVARDGRVEVIGFGSFSLKHAPARVGRNPRTGEIINIPAYKRPAFSAGLTFKKLVNK